MCGIVVTIHLDAAEARGLYVVVTKAVRGGRSVWPASAMCHLVCGPLTNRRMRGCVPAPDPKFASLSFIEGVDNND